MLTFAAIKSRLKKNQYARLLLKPVLKFIRPPKSDRTPTSTELVDLAIADPSPTHEPASTAPFLYYIDFPQAHQTVQFPVLILSGWIAFDKDSKLKDLTFGTETGFVSDLITGDRSDVEATYPHLSAVGFLGCLPVEALQDSQTYHIQFWLDNDLHTVPVNLKISLADVENFVQRKQKKLQRIQTILSCPVCQHEQLTITTTQIICHNCAATFANEQQYNFLSQDLIDHGRIKPTHNISFRSYSETVLSIIQEFPDGLILDNGCGMRDIYFDNVVNFEIVDYPTTDVLGIGEKLPFKSNSFDAVFSVAVLEHVKNPFECAAEIIRVLKPGGKLYAVVPFLQPFHGYPDHYYNMTSNGLKNLFEKDLEILEMEVGPWGKPIWSLNWFLKSYLRGLPTPVAEKFKQMRVADLLDYPLNYLEQDFVAQVKPEVDEELACLNCLLAKKR